MRSSTNVVHASARNASFGPRRFLESRTGTRSGWPAATSRQSAPLPSLGVDPISGASDEPFALVLLGRCNVRTATRLAAVLEGVAAGGDET